MLATFLGPLPPRPDCSTSPDHRARARIGRNPPVGPVRTDGAQAGTSRVRVGTGAGPRSARRPEPRSRTRGAATWPTTGGAAPGCVSPPGATRGRCHGRRAPSGTPGEDAMVASNGRRGGGTNAARRSEQRGRAIQKPGPAPGGHSLAVLKPVPTDRHADPRSAHDRPEPLGRLLRGTAHRLDPAGVSGSRPRSSRAAPPPHPDPLLRVLSPHSDSPLARDRWARAPRSRSSPRGPDGPPRPHGRSTW